MKPLMISVIIPTYNGKEYLSEAIQSVLDQTYPNFEIIIVDDASPEDISPVINSFTDSRMRYIRHSKNKGAVSARKTGVGESNGEIIAFLDQDDLFHTEKLEKHVNYFLRNPEIGLTYNDRLEVQGSDKELCGIYRPPANLTLADWVLGFPISPSDAVLRREWATLDEIWDDSFAGQTEHVIFNGQEIVFGGRLALAGCKFGSVDRALNYRRYHPYRTLKYLFERCKAELACQNLIFSDPRCPDDIKSLKNRAFSNIYLMWAYTAYIQKEFDLGKSFLREALVLNPAFFSDGDPCEFLKTWLLWISAGTVDYVRGHEEILHSVFENLPPELQSLTRRYDWAIARSYLLKGLHTMVWGKWNNAELSVIKALEKGAEIDIDAMSMFNEELLNYENELGGGLDQKIINELSNLLLKYNEPEKVSFIKSFYAINRAFRNFNMGKYDVVPGDVITAIKNNTRYLLNRGALSILVRSILWRVGFS